METFGFQPSPGDAPLLKPALSYQPGWQDGRKTTPEDKLRSDCSQARTRVPPAHPKPPGTLGADWDERAEFNQDTRSNPSARGLRGKKDVSFAREPTTWCLCLHAGLRAYSSETPILN